MVMYKSWKGAFTSVLDKEFHLEITLGTKE